MSHAYVANFAHCIFSTKDRRNLISPDLQPQLYAYLIGTAKNLQITMVAVGGMPNHVHLLIAVPPAMALSVAIQKLKANSSRWMGEQGLSFEWQKGYAAFSVSPSSVEVVTRYIRNQEQHHRVRTFEEEFIALLKKCGLAYDKDVFAA
ncbi:MAG TPA: IS200/IS605 family transposase [Terriglobales bacterium]|jgi:putative transposase|nr:IS200/IS605 family transposase [Terriglobales bacterium]